MGLKHRPKPQRWRGARKRRPSKLPAVGAALVVARFAHRGNGATTRVAPTSSLRLHEPTVIAFHDAAIPSDWPKRATRLRSYRADSSSKRSYQLIDTYCVSRNS